MKAILPALFLSSLAAAAMAQEGASLADMIECRAARSELGALAAAISTDPDAAADYGLRRMESPNMLVLEYATDSPVEAFGMRTSRIAFVSFGLVGLFEDADAPALARQYDVIPVIDSDDKFLGEKLISETVEDDSSLKMRFRTRIALNVSTVDTHPGIVLAGCTYAVTTEDLP